MPNSQTKYIIIGVIFWLSMLVMVIVIIQTNSSQKNIIVAPINTKIDYIWFVQVASFEDMSLLQKLDKKLLSQNYKTNIVFSSDSNGNTIRAVRVGPYNTELEAKRVVANLAINLNLRPTLVSQNKE